MTTNQSTWNPGDDALAAEGLRRTKGRVSVTVANGRATVTVAGDPVLTSFLALGARAGRVHGSIVRGRAVVTVGSPSEHARRISGGGRLDLEVSRRLARLDTLAAGGR